MRNSILAILILSGFAAGPAQAQAQFIQGCHGRVVIDLIYETAVGGGRYEYFVMLRSATERRVTVDMSFSGFPPSMTLVSPSRPNIVIAPAATAAALRLGSSTSQLNPYTFAHMYNHFSSSSGQTVRASNCRLS